MSEHASSKKTPRRRILRHEIGLGIRLPVDLPIFLPRVLRFDGGDLYRQSIPLLLSALPAFLGIELSRMGTGRRVKWDDLGIGLFLTVAALAAYRYFDNRVLNVIFSAFVLLFGFYGLISGIFDLVRDLISGETIKGASRHSTLAIFVAIVQIVGLIAGVLQSLQILKVIR